MTRFRDRTFNILNIVIGVIAVIVAILSLRSVNTKELTVTYFAKRELVTLVTPTSMDLEVKLNGTRVESPWLLSARLENTGNQPIEKDDVEEPVRLTFKMGKVLGARIVRRSHEQLFGDAVVDGNAVVIQHKLLNHGDWVAFDIIFEGEPELRPDLFARISGVELRQVPLEADTQKKFLTVVPLPVPLVWVLLLVCTVAVVISIIFGSTVIVKELTRMAVAARARTARVLAMEAASVPEESEVLSSTPHTSVGDMADQILEALGGSVDKKLIDSLPLLSRRIAERNVDRLLASLGLNADRAASMLSTALKQSLRDDIGTKLSAHMASDLARETRRAIRAIDVSNISTRELRERAREVAAEVSDSMPAAPPVDKDGIAFGILFMTIGLFLLLILGGTWRTVFS